jgi:hypothetical protein
VAASEVVGIGVEDEEVEGEEGGGEEAGEGVDRFEGDTRITRWRLLGRAGVHYITAL